MEFHVPQPLSGESLRVATLREQVADLLREAIVGMRFKPGQRLVERELIEWLGVSRATVREAVRELAAEGLVQTIPQKGAVVAAPSVREATEVYAIRAALEGLAARLFTEHATAAQKRALRRNLEALQKVVAEGGETTALLQAKNRFYGTLFAGADNRVMVQLIGSLQARITVLRAASMSQPGRAAATLEEVGAIVDAIDAGDADAASAACTYHVQQAARCALASLPSMWDGEASLAESGRSGADTTLPLQGS